eukprot:15214033-Alexandrium_andersonii.AAC.1
MSNSPAHRSTLRLRVESEGGLGCAMPPWWQFGDLQGESNLRVGAYRLRVGALSADSRRNR